MEKSDNVLLCDCNCSLDQILFYFYAPGRVAYSSWTVRHSVRLSVCPSENFNIGQNFCNIEDSNLIFGMHVYLMELHILSDKRSRSSFKVKGQKTKSKGSNKL